MKDPKKILLLKNRALGDAFIALSAIKYIVGKYPNCIIHYSVPKWVAPILENLDLSHNIEIVPMGWQSWQDFSQNAKKILAEKYDFIYEFHQGGRTRKFFKLCSVFLKINYGSHNHNLRFGTDVFDQGVTKNCMQRDLDGLWSYLGKIEKRPCAYKIFENYTACNKRKLSKIIVVGVSAGQNYKLWPLENYKKILEDLAKDFGYKFIIPLSNSELDQKLAGQILDWKLFKEKRVQIIQVPLQNLPPILKGTDCYIGNDTGIKHIMAYFSRPTFTIFKKESPFEWSPYLDYKKHQLIWDDKTSISSISKTQKMLISFLRENDLLKS